MEEFVKTVSSLLIDVVIEQGLSLFIATCKKVIKNVSYSQQWKNVFKKSAVSILDEDIDDNDFIDLATILSERNVRELGNQLEKCSEYEIEEKATDFLTNLMVMNNIGHDRAEYLSRLILVFIAKQLRADFPEKYDRYFQENWRKQETEYLDGIKQDLSAIDQGINEVKENFFRIQDAEKLDKELNEKSKYESFGICSFPIDDERFQSVFDKQRNKDEIFIRCRNKEEGIYCIINELWRLEEKRTILIVYNENGWENLRRNSVRGKILIPFFHSKDIFPISGNTNIYVMANDNPDYKGSTIELRPRTYDTIVTSLISAGMDRNLAYDFVAKNHGLYALMRRYLFKGVHENEPNWVKSLPENVIKTCLMLSQWTDTEGDQEVVEKLSGLPYEEFVASILKSSKDENPLIHMYENYGKRYYFLANAEDAWANYTISIKDPIWRAFFDLFLTMMKEKENLMIYDTFLEKTHAEMNGEKNRWSGIIRSGMVHSLMIKAYYLNDEPDFQKEIDKFVLCIMTSVDDENKWRFLSYYITDLIELSPDIVLDRLETEFSNSTGMQSLFDNQKDNFMWKNHFYINILRSLEQLLLQRKYATRAFEILININSFGYKYQGNRPDQIIRMVLCPWANFSAIKKTSEKKKIAEKLFLYDACNAWDIVYSVLPENQQSVFGELTKPKYRDCETLSNVTQKDLLTTKNDYFNLLVDNAKRDPSNWSKLLEYGAKISNQVRSVLFEKLSSAICEMTDFEKATIKDEIRDLIYKNRYFSTSAWAMSETTVLEYEKLLDSIVVNQKELDFCVYFNKSPYDIPIFHPVPHEDIESINKNTELAKDIVKEKIRQFKEQNLNLEIIINDSSKRNFSYLGYYLGLFWNEKTFDLNVFKQLIKSQESGVLACSYFENSGKKALVLFDEIIGMMNKDKCNQSCIIRFYKAEAHMTESIPAISNADEEIKRVFWSEDVFGIENTEWAIEECKKYGNAFSFLQILYYANQEKHFPNEYLFDQFKIIKDMDVSHFSGMDTHYLLSLLKPLQNDYLFITEKREILVEIELKFSNMLEWSSMVCTQYEVKKTPDLYTDVLKLIYKKDEGCKEENDVEVNSEMLYQYFYRLYDKMHFCPAEENGNVKEDQLKKWVDRFDELLKKNKQTRIRGMILGHLFAFSPAGKDGFSPCESIRDMIEKVSDSSFSSAYHTTIYNNRGTHECTSGRQEIEISDRFRATADYFAITHPKTASIYQSLADTYLFQAEQERRQAENGF